jgi:hypothetical protein
LNKLLLLLFISLSFIGSANANSIKGAFGYELGEVQNPDFKECYENQYCYTSSKFQPKKPLPGYDSYSFNTTFTSNKIYRISASRISDAEISDTCYGYGSDFGNILGMLESKYGKFSGLKSDILNQTGQMTTRSSVFEYRDGERRIFISCYFEEGNEKFNVKESFNWHLNYYDYKLEQLNREEEAAAIKKIFLEESKDYDI